MATVTATGTSAKSSSTAAAEEAIAQALEGLGGKAPTIGFLFASAKHELSVALRAASAAAGTEIVACSTAGELTERGLTRGGVAAMLIASDDVVHDVATAAGLKAGPGAAAQQLCARFQDTARAAAARGFAHSTTVVLVDGLCGVGERLVRDVMHGTRAFQQVVGGAAGDDGAFKATWVGARREAATDAAAAVHFFGPRPWGVGVDHGLRPITARMTVTKATANVIHEIDGKPAIEVYRKHAKDRGVTLDAQSTGRFLIGNELGVFFLDQLRHARAPIAAGTDGSLTCAADVAQGSTVCILDGEPDSMVAAARRAAHEALGHLDGAKAAGVLLFDCVCRGMILGDAFQREIDAIRQVFPDVPVLGFLTYGEIARFKGRLDGWHNTTAVVAAIPA